MYLYTCESASAAEIEEMKKRAREGVGLSEYIKGAVYYKYESKTIPNPYLPSDGTSPSGLSISSHYPRYRGRGRSGYGDSYGEGGMGSGGWSNMGDDSDIGFGDGGGGGD